MSELVPDHLSIMRETLSRFCDEIRSFHADHGNDLAPGSPAVHTLVQISHKRGRVDLVRFG